MKLSKAQISIAVILFILIADQVLKIWVKTSMYYEQSIPMFGEWGKLHFIENNGMAFGLELGGTVGKYALSIFRILAIGGIIWYLTALIRRRMHTGLIICISLIVAGATGNLIDSMFYGLIFNESHPYQMAELFPDGGGYTGFLQGRVVDMFYFPIIRDYPMPDWVPFFGGEPFTFFRPVFNIADASITVGVIALIMFQGRFFKKKDSAEPEAPAGRQ